MDIYHLDDDQIKFLESHQDFELIVERFSRETNDKQIYLNRLYFELYVIIKKDFTKHLLLVCDILDEIGNVPHVIRGSSGSSLVCYYLGITNIDPIKENISFARFLSMERKNMPDIDMDFPYNRREEIFKKINHRWDGKVARISNHIHFGERGALREAIREAGYRKRILKHQLSPDILPDKSDQILKRAIELEGEFSHYSLHCGGIVIYENGVPKEDMLKNRSVENQVKYDKRDVERLGQFKIDILSNRGLAQLMDISNKSLLEYSNDPKVYEMLHQGNNIGITFGESPAMKKAFCGIKPKSIQDIALCLAIIRPAATEDGQKTEYMNQISQGKHTNYIIYDDDAIQYISSLIHCNEGMADTFRKGFSKRKMKDVRVFEKIIEEHNDISFIQGIRAVRNLRRLQKYSFCKSHAVSYAQLVYALAYQKLHNPKKFWLSTLNHCNSYYRKWVHFSEARASGLKLTLGRKPWIIKNSTVVGVGRDNKKNKLSENPSSIEQFLTYGYWTGNKFLPNMYIKIIDKKKRKLKFRGLIATSRPYYGSNRKYVRRNNQRSIINLLKSNNGCTFVTIGHKFGYLVNLILFKATGLGKYDAISGEGYLKTTPGTEYSFIEVETFKLERLIISLNRKKNIN